MKEPEAEACELKATGTMGDVLPFTPLVKLHHNGASPTASKRNEQAVKLHHRVRKPRSFNEQRPPRLGNYFFRKKGAGWECLEECGYEVNTESGERRRRQPYVARLSREKWEELQARHSGAELEVALLYWIEERKASKQKEEHI